MAKSQISASYFVSILTIAQIEQATVLADVNLFITQYADDVMKLLLGDVLFDAYVAGMNAGLPDARWTALDVKLYDLNKKLSPAANYVYWLYQRNVATQTTGTGEKLLKAENSTSVGNAVKAKLAWNAMVRLNRTIVGWIKNSGSYPEYVEPQPDFSTPESKQLYKDRLNVLKTVPLFF